MKKNGFTLVELIAVIAILALIIGIATLSITAISNSIKNKQRENTIKAIELAGSKYAFDFDIGNNTVSVSTLVSNGYLEDDAVEFVTNENMLNRCVRATKVKDYYKASLTESTNCNN